MKLTNSNGLPEAIVRAIKHRNSMYNARADISVTSLISPPQLDTLRKAHANEIVRDASEELFALLGSAVHQILEWGSQDEITEERLFVKYNDWTISGQIDLQRDGDNLNIVDYKVTAAYSITGDLKKEWIEQLNLYAYLVWINKGIRVSSINIVAIIRDWSRKQATMDMTYPQSPVLTIPLPLWSIAEQEEYLRTRVRMHQETRFAYDMGTEMIECSHEERWAKPDKWAVTKKGQKRAKVFTDELEANSYAEEHGVEVEFRPGESTRCLFYCPIRIWCPQQNALNAGKAELADGAGDQETVLRGGVVGQEAMAEISSGVTELDPQGSEEHNVERGRAAGEDGSLMEE